MEDNVSVHLFNDKVFPFKQFYKTKEGSLARIFWWYMFVLMIPIIIVNRKKYFNEGGGHD